MRGGFLQHTTAEYTENSGEADLLPPTRSHEDFSMISSWDPLLTQLNMMMSLGFSRPLQNGDLGTIPPDAKKEYLIERFKRALKEEESMETHKQSIWKVLLKTIGMRRVFVGIFFAFIGSGCQFSGPMLLKAISNQLIGVNPLHGGSAELWILIALAFAVPVLGTICNNQSNICFNYMGIQVRNVMTSVIFEKVLRGRSADLEAGLIINMANVDSKALESVFGALKTVIVIPGKNGVCKF